MWGGKMRYFLSEAERKQTHSTCYFEFQKGAYQGECWLSDSLYLYVDVFDDLKLFKLFSGAIPHFEYYGVTTVSKDEWQALVRLSKECGGEKEAVISELTSWVEKCFEIEEVFTIWGM